MALRLDVAYPGQVTTGDAGFPYGKPKNQAVDGDGTGTPWEERLAQDLAGAGQAILVEGRVVPSGSPDRVGNSDNLTALKNIMKELHAEAAVQNWRETSVALGSTRGDALVWNPGDRLWYFFGKDGSNNPQGSRSLAGDLNTATFLTIPAGSTLIPAAGAAAANPSGVIIFGGNAGSANTKIRESADGTTWNARSTVAGAGANVSSAIWHPGAAKFIIGLDNSAATNIETSSNGQTWAQITGLPNTHARGPMCTNGTIALLFARSSVVGNTDKYLSTVDGVAFTEGTLPTSQRWHGAVWESRSGKFLAFGSTNWAHSSDGLSWTNGGIAPVNLGSAHWPSIGVVSIGRALLFYGSGTALGYAGYYDGTLRTPQLVLNNGADHVYAAASDGQWMVLATAQTLHRTLAAVLR